MYTFMGGDAEYSVNTQRCTPGMLTASLGCVYQWNQGAFADPLVRGRGASFYRGSRFNVPGNGPMNGYTPHWAVINPYFGQPYVLSRLRVKHPAETITWHDAADNPRLTPIRAKQLFGVVCEVQDAITTTTTTTTRPPTTTTTTTRPPTTTTTTTRPPTTTTTTTRPPTTTTTTTRPPTTTTKRPPTTTTTTTRPPANTTKLAPEEVVVPWAKKHWYVLILAVVLPLIAALALIIIICCCCCRGVDESKWVTPMVLREVSGDVRYAANQRWGSGLDSFEDPVFPMCPPREQGNGVLQNSWMTPPAPAAYASPSFGLPSRSSRRRTSSGIFAGVEVPRGDEIAEGWDDASLGNTRELRRDRPSGSVVTWEDTETIGP
ncbi:uncharacterized protein Tco025E_08335 [Trypanosoma conorhini]|uniref:Uncharacterized protein n=1 Tax=Trypanosoma conorhini TaxID=83891 RepID=A0A422NBL8_9TRYP|nr:uncharacterized protein Tco025E_08335 [Trypanosoma conorhini]RNF02863.1 hypothetical protein Tco025E_08335 [Trypanosoma conorhini]